MIDTKLYKTIIIQVPVTLKILFSELFLVKIKVNWFNFVKCHYQFYKFYKHILIYLPCQILINF